MVAPVIQSASFKARPYPGGWCRRLTLPNGETVVLRPMQADDVPRMVDFHQSLSDQSVHWRYFRTMPLAARIAPERLATICRPDPASEAVLVAEWEADDGVAHIVAVGRLEDLPGGRAAEFAVVVADAWQRQGLGREMLRDLIELAKAAGRSRLVGDILPDNTRMQRMCRRLGFDVGFDFEDRMTRATLTLNGP